MLMETEMSDHLRKQQKNFDSVNGNGDGNGKLRKVETEKNRN